MNSPAEKLQDDGPRLGLFDDIPNAEYHGGPGISKSGLDLINQSPLHYITNKRHPKPSTPAMVIGSAFHALVLEPDLFEKEYTLPPQGAPKRPTATQLNAKNPSAAAMKSIAYWEQWDAENEGKIIIENKTGDDPFWQPGDWDRLHHMRDAILEHPYASILLDPDQGKAEQSVYWIDERTKKLCKCRPDFINDAHNVAIDLKSTNDASYTEFAKSSAKFRYHVQDPFYRDGLSKIGHPVRAFIFVAVEKQPPWGIGIYKLSPEERRIGRIEYQRNLDIYAECHQADEWPCYPTILRDLVLPPWGLRGRVS
ncbi:MAG: PD-(D/E)XK nuclease-like domain-containing protein [Candidatus Thiodiazotropha sp. (ex Codakia orbicularis)]|nr:PD-(D/E)XK nuclease-like domain-containing protein [Candidatus Thiodiazotropha sp. (ex Codakia orbicularis)]